MLDTEGLRLLKALAQYENEVEVADGDRQCLHCGGTPQHNILGIIQFRHADDCDWLLANQYLLHLEAQ